MRGPVYIRLSRMPVPQLQLEDPFVPGKARRVRPGSDLTIIATGTTVHLAAEASDKLSDEGVSARVLDMHTLNPLDEEALAAAATETGAIVTVEEAHEKGGLGGAVSEFTASTTPVPVERIGFPGFMPTGSVSYLFDEFGLTPDGIAAGARRALKRKRA